MKLFLIVGIVLVSLSLNNIFGQSGSVDTLNPLPNGPVPVSSTINTPLVGPLSSISPLFTGGINNSLYSLPNDSSTGAKIFLIRTPFFFIGSYNDTTDYSFTTAASPTTIIECSDTEPLSGAAIFVENAYNTYSRLAYIVGRGGAGQQLHLKLHESILFVPDFSSTWLSNDSNRLLQQFNIGGGEIEQWNQPRCYYLEAVATGTTILTLACLQSSQDPNTFNGYRKTLKDMFAFTIQVDDDNTSVSVSQQ